MSPNADPGGFPDVRPGDRITSDEADDEAFAPLVVDLVERADRVTVRPAGEVDPSTVARLREALDAASSTGAPVIEVDCIDLRFLDSAGVNLLAVTQRRHELGDGPRLELTNTTGIVARVLEVSGVAQRLGRPD